MSEARMTSKGQITVPKDVRLKLGLRPGDRIRFLLEADGRVRLMPAKRTFPNCRDSSKAKAGAIDRRYGRSHWACRR